MALKQFDSIQASESIQSVQSFLAAGNTAGNSTVTGGDVYFSGGANITISMSSNSIAIIGGAGGGGGSPNISAGTTSNNLGSIVFGDGNGVSFGLNGSTITGSVAGGVPNISAGTTSNNLGSIIFSNSNNFSFGLNGSTITGSYTVPTLTSFSVQDGATTINPVNRIAFSTGNNITLSLSTGAGSATVGVSHNLAGTSTGFGGNLISASMTNNSSGFNLSLSHPAWLTTAALSQDSSKYVQNWKIAGNTSGTTSSAQGSDLWLAGGNGVTLSGSSNSISFNVNTSPDQISLIGNTAGTTLWSVGGDAFVFSGGANVTLSGNNSTLVISAGGTVNQTGPNIAAGASTITNGTVVFSNSNGVSFGLNGSTMTASIPLNATMSSYFEGNQAMTLLTAPTNGSISVERFFVPQDVSATMMALPVYQSISSSAVANTYGQQWSVYAMILTNDTANSRWMSLSSGSTQTTYTLASNNSGATQIIGSGVRPVTVPINAVMTPGVYHIAWNWSTNTFSSGTATTALNRTVSMIGRDVQMSASFAMVSAYDVATGVTNNVLFPQGVVNGASNGIPTTISHSQVTMTGAANSQANLAFYMRA